MPDIWSKSLIWVSDFSGGHCFNTTLNIARLKQTLALISGQTAATWCKFFCAMALHQSHTQLLRTVSTPKQSMTLLVAGQFVGNSIPPRVVPCATANSPMFAALASSPIVTTPINPNVPRPQCPMPPLLQKTATKHNFARPVTPIAKSSGCMGALVGWWLWLWFHPTLCEVWCFPHWSWQMPGAYPPCISVQWPLSYHRSSVPTCHSADTRWTGKR